MTIHQDSNYTLAHKLKLQNKTRRFRIPVCLFCDFDDTYIMKYWPSEQILETHTQKFTDTILFPDASRYNPTIDLKTYLDNHHIPLIIVSGRDIHQMKEIMNKFRDSIPDHPEIMSFDGIVGAVGTEIYLRTQTNDYVQDKQYYTLLQQTDFKRDNIHVILSRIIPQIKKDVGITYLDFSKRDRSNLGGELPKQPYKLSLEFKTSNENAKRVYDYIRNQLNENGITTIKLLMSSPYRIDDVTHKFNMDIVPLSKEKPILYLKKKWHFASIVAGDSGNDFDMLVKAADHAILVGNAKNELRDSIESLPKNKKEHIYFASSNDSGPKAVLSFFSHMLS
ncbi:MAG: HAD family hydrolase [Patescibacteria group bacterium]